MLKFDKPVSTHYINCKLVNQRRKKSCQAAERA